MKLILLLTLLLLISCSTTRRNARKHMENKKWEKAHKLWSEILIKDPKDEEAVKGQEEAEFRLTAELSTAIRDKRMAGDIRGALDAAVKVQRKHQEWNRKNNDVNMSKFREVELRKLYRPYLKMLQDSLNQKLPLKGSFEYENYRVLFGRVEGDRITLLGRKLKSLGRSHCMQVKDKGHENAYWRNFVRKFCNYYGYKLSNKDGKSKHINNAHYGALKINDRSYSSQSSLYKNMLIEAFQKSTWFRPGSNKVLNVDYRMNSSSRSDTSKSYKEHRYKKDGKDKVYRYKILNHYSRYSFDIETSFNLFKQEYMIPYSNSRTFTDYSYEGNSTPYISSHSVKIPSFYKWASGFTKKYKSQVLDKFELAWSNSFCKLINLESDHYKRADAVLKCALGSKADKIAIDSWFRSNYSVNYAEAIFVLP